MRPLSVTIRKQRSLPFALRLASTAVPQDGSSAHRFLSGAKFADQALLFHAQMQVPPRRRIPLAFGRGSTCANEVVRVNGPGHI